MSVVLEMLQYPFMVRALVVGILISICARFWEPAWSSNGTP